MQAHRYWEAGVAAGQRGAWKDAATAFARAAQNAPQDVLMWLNLANARRNQEDVEGALAAICKCLQCDAQHQMVRRLGVEIVDMHLARDGAIAQQLAALPKALLGDAVLLTAVAQKLLSARRAADAVAVAMAALASSPAHVDAHEILLYCMRDLGLKNEAAECARTVLALRPDHLAVRMHLFFDQRGACDWTDLDATRDQLVAAIEAADDDAVLPLPVFSLLSADVEPAVQLKTARIAARCFTSGPAALPAPQSAQRRNGPLRVGLLSCDFRDHPVTQLLAETIEKMDRRRCQVHLYAHGPYDSSAWRGRLRAAADVFVDFESGTFVDFGDGIDAAIARRIRDDAIDVLVELGGHTRGSRLGVLQHRPAPVQVSFLGYPGTTGSEHVDYLVGDAIVTPLEHAAHYSEKLAQISGCLLPASRHRPLPMPMTRAACGLPDDALVLCAFNQAYKLLPCTFDVWCEALSAAPKAVLWLKAPNDDVVRNLRREAASRGVDPQRLVFADDKVGYDAHFSRLALADLFVDNWPYNAHTTASDALWAGLPLLTLRGRNFASRVAASLLHEAGLEAFVCDGVDHYRERLLRLVQQPQALCEAREYLQRERLNLPIFNSQAFSSDLLALFERMHQRWMQGLEPEHLQAVPSTDRSALADEVPGGEDVTAAEPIRLHIGGKQGKPGWKLLNIQSGPAVDYVGDLRDLSSFADASVQEVYASHVLEHVSQQDALAVLQGLRRLLVVGGRLMVSVPDLEVLSQTIITPHATMEMKFHAMRMMFGGQTDAHDFHYFGWTFEFMRHFLQAAGFARVERVESFGLFEDTSEFKPWGFPISLNVIATATI
jgi:predicted O-linked N-acetylglucosamine transferase (SPINDLY family)/predicted SAM-dependent methyltransferase